MKNFILAGTALTCLMMTSRAQANYSLDFQKGAIKCRGVGAIMTIDADRNIISFFNYGANGYGMTYLVAHKDTDGETFASYSSEDNSVILKFANARDSVQFGAEVPPIALTCFHLVD